ncbi:hypothetical protein AMECASPLE_013303 [Ameca splendens]|uniref:Uncharacterized protein n=1 Tax=Ameca splendens TaxID=208324 RepID=A0ABV0ZC29_9TELE
MYTKVGGAVGSTCSQKFPGLTPGLGFFCMKFACSPYACRVLSGYCSFLPESKYMNGSFVSLKFPLGVNGCLCFMLPCDGQITCPGCTPSLARRPLKKGTSSPATQYGRRG